VFINGLEAAQVTGLLEARGFACGAGTQTQTRRDWACQYTSPDGVFGYYVNVYGHGPDRIYAVYALFIGNTGAGSFPLAADFIRSIASLSYDDGDPEGAQLWVNENISSTDAKQTFGSAAFSMYGLSFVKILEMTAVVP
jgi:hypothetical protein